MKTLALLGCALVILAAGCDKPAAPAPTKEATVTPSATPAAGAAAAADLKAGDAAPDVTFVLQSGKSETLASLKGKTVAIYFYPADQTTGCTIEAQGIRDSWADMQAAGVTVIGVSTQDATSHQAFIDKEKLPYDLAVDNDQKLAKAFGVPVNNGYAARQTFLVGKDGKLVKVWRSVTPKDHAKEIITAAKS